MIIDQLTNKDLFNICLAHYKSLIVRRYLHKQGSRCYAVTALQLILHDRRLSNGGLEDDGRHVALGLHRDGDPWDDTGGGRGVHWHQAAAPAFPRPSSPLGWASSNSHINRNS
ncbi:unnamed protein product [Trichogramma brassicae]|uniref:Uncharacterized protein n=1 Tax=Trichogramma brassicae TaxID=86971 RepID=A0A6H5J3R1_9HYME|nr:unnamed protein product [Trichogramma brassicae]